MKIIILGGGTAGWITALFADKYFKGHDITLIASDKIGTVGVGEGTVSGIKNTLDFLDIDLFDIIKKAKGSIKNGVNFVNWNGDGKRYLHSFPNENYSYLLNDLINKNVDLNKVLYENIITYSNKIDLNNISFALHFDNWELGNYLKTIATRRGVKFKEGELKEVYNKKGKINKVKLKDNSVFDCDFIFDCSGFSKRLIGQHYKTKWISYSDYLPMKKVVIFKTKYEKELMPVSDAFAMKYGWIFRIPLQHRIGTGYIFDSNYITSEQALEEASIFFKQKVEPLRELEFEAGVYDKVWVNNCIAVGLANGFIEPLEGTSIWQTCAQLHILSHFLSYIKDTDQKSIDRYNEIIKINNNNSLDFIHLHYITKRKDSKFWREFRNKNKMPETLKTIFNKLCEGSLNYTDIEKDQRSLYFSFSSFLLIGAGQKLINKKRDLSLYNIRPYLKEYENLKNTWSKNAINHREFLESL